MSSQTTVKTSAFLSPRYWPTWLAIGMLRAATCLPYRALLALGAALGMAFYYLAPFRRHIAATNLRLCQTELDPRLDDAARAKLLKDNFRATGIGMLEAGLSWWGKPASLRALTHLEGLENLHQALARGKGVILLSGHFTTLEIAGRLLSLHAPFHVMYRAHRNALFETVMRRGRERHYDKAIERSDMRAILRSLKQNMPVWYAPDQDYGRKHSVFVPFFGIPAAMITATARLARLSGAAVVPFIPHRRQDGSGYDLRLLPALENFPSEDEHADAARISKLLEDAIRPQAAQYLWTHRRFKTRPAGMQRPYNKRNRKRRT